MIHRPLQFISTTSGTPSMNKWTRFVTSILFPLPGYPELNSRQAKRREVEGSKEQAVRSRGGSDNGLRGEGVDQDFQARGPMLTAS